MLFKILLKLYYNLFSTNAYLCARKDYELPFIAASNASAGVLV